MGEEEGDARGRRKEAEQLLESGRDLRIRREEGRSFVKGKGRGKTH